MRRLSLPVALAAVAALLVGACTPPAPLPAPTVSATSDHSAWQAGLSAPVADPLYPQYGNAGVDVLHYGLDLTWEPTSKTLTGAATLRLRATADLPEIKLDFSRAFAIDSVSLDGATSSGGTADDDLTVPAALAEGRQATLVVRYHGTPTTVPMPSHRGDAEGLGLTIAADGSLWTMQEPYGAFTWYPSNDQPSDKALYDIAITVPDGWVGIAGGTPAGQTGNTYRYTTTDPMATYLATLAVGRYQKETAIGPRGLPLTYWYRPGRDEAMMKVVRKSPEYLQWLETNYGPYPFPSAGVVIVPSRSAMETQQMVTMGAIKNAEPPDYENYVGGILFHEYAHHWFGDTVGPTNWNDLWLNEGWAMYAQNQWSNKRNNVSDQEWETRLRAHDGKLRAQLGPPGRPRADSFAESNVYICPALMLHQIRKQLGDQAFSALARAWVAEHRNTTKDRAAFIAFVNKRSGKDFTQLINTWLDSPTTPSL